MSFFDDLTKKAKDVASTASEKAKEAADAAKVSAAILAERRELDKNYRKIGEWFACSYADDIPSEVADEVAAAKACREKIAALEASRIKDEDPEGAVCPVCGKISDSKFCPHCGAPMGE